MIRLITVNLEVLEQMIYFWQACLDREKVSEEYLTQIAEQPDMALIYDAELNAAGVRKVLSAITNHERMSDASKREWKLWNNNMWILEDRALLDNMIRPVKVLNANILTDKINAQKDIPQETVEIVFLPMTSEEYLIQGNKLIVNFFRVMADLMDEEKVTIGGKPLLDYIEEKILEI